MGDGYQRCVSKAPRNPPPNGLVLSCGDAAPTGGTRFTPMHEWGVFSLTNNGIVFTFKGPVHKNASRARPFAVAFLRDADATSKSIRRCLCLVKCVYSPFSFPCKVASEIDVSVLVRSRCSQPQGHKPTIPARLAFGKGTSRPPSLSRFINTISESHCRASFARFCGARDTLLLDLPLNAVPREVAARLTTLLALQSCETLVSSGRRQWDPAPTYTTCKPSSAPGYRSRKQELAW